MRGSHERNGRNGKVNVVVRAVPMAQVVTSRSKRSMLLFRLLGNLDFIDIVLHTTYVCLT